MHGMTRRRNSILRMPRMTTDTFCTALVTPMRFETHRMAGLRLGGRVPSCSQQLLLCVEVRAGVGRCNLCAVVLAEHLHACACLFKSLACYNFPSACMQCPK